MRHLCHSATLGTAASIPADTVAPAPLATTTLALASTLQFGDHRRRLRLR